MKKIVKIMLVLSVLMTMLIVPVSAEDVTYTIRSIVYDNTESSTEAGDFYWDANTFSGFLYMIKPGLSSELLYLHNSVNASNTIQLGDTIEEGDLYYISKPQKKKTKIAGSDDSGTFMVDDVDLEFYYLMGFFGPKYVVMPEDPSAPSQGCKPDKIAKILLESDDKKNVASGEVWELAGCWTLVVDQVDVEGEKVWVHLNYKGEEIDSGVISSSADLTNMEKTYLYKDSDDYPVFYCTVESVFSGTDTNFAVFKYAYLRGDLTTIENGDTYGIFDVEGFEVPALMNDTNYAGSNDQTVLNTGDDAVVLSSNKAVTLNPDEQIDLHGGLYLKTESGNCLKMTLWKTCTIKVDNTAEEENPTEENDDIVVVDLAEDSTEKEENTVSSTQDETEVQTDEETEEEFTVESSVSAPGFELLLGFVGLMGASVIRK
ncbi:S-layer protein domain-containing protein [Methanolobus sediminis]|uniref:S-layer protein domain-containing protein n=1 Tax=Methanolobus sediminis TaxID=3072978 RepID=A0AA51UKE1_9EURY|nr:S-layer protein domain-containing protein [Methanolobus sediminis]WMW25176.1 S-layer protein domain-containing protein [Methanolobus sediminis]